MSNVLADIGNKLEALGLGTQTTGSPTIVLGGVPPRPDNLIVLIERPGMEPVHTMGTQATTRVIERIALQTLIRDVDYATGYQRAYAVWGALDWFVGVIGSTFYMLIQARNSPTSIGEDEESRHLFTINYLIHLEPV